MELFTQALVRDEDARNKIDVHRFALDRDCFAFEKEETATAREQWREEREGANKKDMEKFRVMLEVFKDAIRGD